MRRLTLFFFLLFSMSAHTALANSSNSSICSTHWSNLQAKLREPTSRMAFKNDGGIGDGGVCWWHSRFQRAAIYLATFAPEKSKPTLSEAKKIIHKLSYLSSVVEIPGYADFNSFSADYKKEIQEQLNRWQIRDGIGGFAWIRGLWGKPSLPPAQMKNRIDKIYSRFLEDASKNHTLWFMEQMPGIVAHASLVIDMKKTSDGYSIELIDSNFPDVTSFVSYKNGDTFLDGPSGEFVPYAGIERDNRKIDRAIARYCGREPVMVEEPENYLAIEQ